MVSLMASFGSFSAVALISIYRCLIIVSERRIRIRRCHVIAMITFGWSVTLLVSIPPTIGVTAPIEYSHGTHHCSPSWQDSREYYTISLVLGYCVTLPTMVTSYGLIVLKVKRSSQRIRELRDRETKMSTEFKSSLAASKQQYKTAAIVSSGNTSYSSRIDRCINTTSDSQERHMEEEIEGETSSISAEETISYTAERKRHEYRRQQKQVAFTGKSSLTISLL